MQSDETLETWGKIVVKCIEFLIHLRFQFAQDRRLQNELHVPENQDRAFPAMIVNGTVAIATQRWVQKEARFAAAVMLVCDL